MFEAFLVRLRIFAVYVKVPLRSWQIFVIIVILVISKNSLFSLGLSDIFQGIPRVLAIFCSFRNSRWVRLRSLRIFAIIVILVIFVKFAVLVGSL